MVRSRAWAATPMNLSPARVGFIRAWKTRFSRKRVSRRGASRKSRALRVGGVSTTTRSNAALLDQLVELLHGHVLLGARQGAGEVPVDPVDLDVLRLLGAVRVALDQVVEGPLGIEHEGVELAGPGPLDPGRAGW